MEEVMSTHKRREDYWPYYELARSEEGPHVRDTILDLIKENPSPRTRKESRRGRPPIHSQDKLDFACIWMMIHNDTYRDAEGYMREETRLPWDEPAPDHTRLVRHMQTIDEGWMDSILAETARLCMAELEEGVTAPLAADSSGVETTRYEDAERPDRHERGFVPARIKTYMKYHITAVLGHQIILAALTTGSSTGDTQMLKPMLEEIRRRGHDLAGRRFSADRGYDSDKNCEAVLAAGWIPNIKGRRNPVNRGKPSRKKAAGMYDPGEYRLRGMCEGIFGAEESRRHQLHCRFLREDNRRRFAKGRAISWNILVLGRFRCANRLGIRIPSYGGAAA